MLCCKNKRMIRWRLRVLMAERNINNKTLAEMTGLNRVTISRLKNTNQLKQISGDVLNQLCNALDCTPNDLIEFTPDLDFPDRQSTLREEESSQQKRVNQESQSPKRTNRLNFNLVPSLEIPESA